MYAQVEKPKENKSRAVANSVMQKKSRSKQRVGRQVFQDNRMTSDKSIGSSVKSVIQRRIGFEFETGQNLRQSNPYENQQLPDGRNIVDFGGWHIDSDEGMLEFVSSPLNNRAELKGTSRRIKGKIDKMKADIDQTGWYRTTEFSIYGGGENIEENTLFYGIPQVSVGMSVNNISRFIDKMKDERIFGHLRNQLEQIKGVNNTEDNKRRLKVGANKLGNVRPNQVGANIPNAVRITIPDFDQVNGPHASEIKNLFAIMAQYLKSLNVRKQMIGNNNEVHYLKSFLPILLRTSFWKIASNSNIQGVLPNFKNEFFNNLNEWDEGIYLAHANDELGIKHITAGDWYDSIARNQPILYKPNDLLSDTSDEMVGEASSKSMGKMGVDNQDGNKVVVELRGVTQGHRIGINKMYELILEPIANVLHGLNDFGP